MTKDDADVFGNAPNAADIVIGLDSGTIVSQPHLNGKTPLPFGPQQITIPTGTLPEGGSFIDVPIVFAPGDPDANITVISGPGSVNPPARLDATMTPAGIDLFGVKTGSGV